MTLLMTATSALAGPRRLGFFVNDVDAYACARALDTASDLKDIEIRVFTDGAMNTPATTEFLRTMDVAVVDIMPPRPAEWLLENRSVLKPGVRIYAVRSSSHNQDFLNAGFIMDETVRTYFAFTSADNLANLIRFLSHRDLGLQTDAPPPIVPPENALYHPDAPKLFSDLNDYVRWYRESGHFQDKGLWNLSIVFPTFTLDGKKAPLDALIQAYERQGINTVTWVREMKDRDNNLARLLTTEPLASGLGSITGFDFKFSSTLTGGLAKVLEKANVPIFNAQYLFFSTREDWLASPQGVSPAEIPLQFSTPEISGLVEPTVLGVKERVLAERRDIEAYMYVSVPAHVEILARRAARWHSLRQKSNADKKIALVYYNHGAGKQNIGASYLNVFRSIDTIIRNLKQAGYSIQGELTDEKVKDLLQKSGRNIGSWAPNELDRLLAEGNAAFVNMADYRRWLAQTPSEFREAIEKDWGKPEDNKIMMKDGRFVIPCVRLGNLTLVPQPVRGWSDDPDKLAHSTVLQPHHQYAAFYFWLQNEIRPDAMISLGTHGTHEWLPGKQAGLTWKCPPEVLIGDIPNLYPYIVDDVGEGIQAKRRGRGVVIDHAVPPLKAGGVYAEYSQLAALISEFDSSSSDQIRSARLERIRAMVAKLGLDKDLELSVVNESDLEKIDHYLLTLKTEMIPYGLHTFGVSPSGEALAETATAMAEKGGQSAQFYQEQLLACGPSEMSSLIRGLSGGYIPSGPGNDPIRNPESLPTGKNFYGFDPEKTPSREAWENGKKAAQELIDAYRKKHEGKCPEQVGVILWSVETIRDEGINVATALYLMGMTPVWDHRDKVRDVAPIPGPELNRPRIDVLLQMSGLFRDSFPNVALLLDRAVKQAATLTDLENFLSKHSKALEASLIKEGHSPEAAKKLSLIRLFSAPPGAYGTKVKNLTGASGMWEKDDGVAEQGFIQMQSSGYSSDMWGEKLTPVYRQHLKKVDATVHTISSNLYGTMDNDDMFQYLGGISMAVRKESGKDPDVFISMQRTRGQGHVESLATTLGQELRSRYLNPTWIEGMKKESYAGAREMAEFMENMWGWQVTTPGTVDAAKWENAFEVYVEDKYGLDIKEFMNRENPWAHQSMTARMLEAVRKNYWHADEKITRKLAAEYAQNVVEKGVACSDHICNNPVLNQMVEGIISVPGVLSPEIVEKFTHAVEQAAGRSLDQQVQDRLQLLQALKESPVKPDASLQPDNADPESPLPDKANPEALLPDKTADSAKDIPITVEGYRMEKNSDDTLTRVNTSGVQWFAAVFILLLIGLFVIGAQTYPPAYGQRARVRNRWLIRAVILTSCLLTAGVAQARHGEQTPATLESITVTAERISEYVKNHPQEVTILEQKEIRERNILGVEEALGMMPGVDVRRSSGIGARISIRGSGKSGGVLVLLNGRPLNTSQYGNVDLSTLPIDTVKSITVFRPPVPVWLGAGASEGAISIVTHDFAPSQKKPDPPPTRLRFGAGSYGLAEASASSRFKLENGNTMLTASGSHRDGKRANSDKDSGMFSLHWDREILDEARLETDSRFYTAEYGAPGPTDNPTPDARQKYQKGSLDTRVKGIIGESGDYAVNVYGDIIGLNDKSQSGATSIQDYLKLGIKPQTHFSSDTDTWGFRLGSILEQENIDETLSGRHHRVSSGLSTQYDHRWDPVTASLLKMAAEWYLQIDNLWNTGFEIHHGYPDDGIRFSTGINLMF